MFEQLSLHQHFSFFLLFVGFFVSLQQLCYEKLKNPKLAKLVWQMPAHIMCFVAGSFQAEKTPTFILTVADKSDHFSEAYCFFYAYWVSTCFDFFYRKQLQDTDSTIMRLHHMMTLLALLFSDYLGYRPMGLFVLYLHDWSDVWIMFLKLVYKMKCHAYVQSLVYMMCMIVWIYTRLYVFCYQLCYCLLFGPLITEYRQRPFEIIPVLALYVLCSCNIIWTFMLLKLCFVSTKKAIDSYEIN